MEIEPSITRFELLAEHHNVQPFTCGNDVLTDYLVNHASREMQKSLSFARHPDGDVYKGFYVPISQIRDVLAAAGSG